MAKSILVVGSESLDYYVHALVNCGYVAITLETNEQAREYLLRTKVIPDTILVEDRDNGRLSASDLLSIIFTKGISSFSRTGFLSGSAEISLRERVESLGIKYFQRQTADTMSMVAYYEGVSNLEERK